MSELTDLFGNIANAIRTKNGSSAAIKAADFPSAIEGIPVGGGLEYLGKITYSPEGTYVISSNVLKGHNGVVFLCHGPVGGSQVFRLENKASILAGVSASNGTCAVITGSYYSTSYDSMLYTETDSVTVKYDSINGTLTATDKPFLASNYGSAVLTLFKW